MICSVDEIPAGLLNGDHELDRTDETPPRLADTGPEGGTPAD